MRPCWLWVMDPRQLCADPDDGLFIHRAELALGKHAREGPSRGQKSHRVPSVRLGDGVIQMACVCSRGGEGPAFQTADGAGAGGGQADRTSPGHRDSDWGAGGGLR